MKDWNNNYTYLLEAMYSMFHANMQIDIYIDMYTYYNMNYNQEIHKKFVFTQINYTKPKHPTTPTSTHIHSLRDLYDFDLT